MLLGIDNSYSNHLNNNYNSMFQFKLFFLLLLTSNLVSIMGSSGLAVISNYPQDPLTMFRDVLSHLKANFLVSMNLATIDSEFGILNREIIFRGLVDDAVTFVTEKNSRKYKNLKENSNISASFYFPRGTVIKGEDVQIWQVRLFDATATELPEEQLNKFWQEEPIYAKIRSYISNCGAPVDLAEQKLRHDQLLNDCLTKVDELPKTETYTAFGITGNRWDFWKTEPDKIADRVQYRKKDNNVGWEVFHVAP